MSDNKKTYLGDAVYASFDGCHIWLETSDGISTTNRIALEPYVVDALIEFAKSVHSPPTSEELPPPAYVQSEDDDPPF